MIPFVQLLRLLIDDHGRGEVRHEPKEDSETQPLLRMQRKSHPPAAFSSHDDVPSPEKKQEQQQQLGRRESLMDRYKSPYALAFHAATRIQRWYRRSRLRKAGQLKPTIADSIIKIQKSFRKYHKRTKRKKDLLFTTWHALEMKEESELRDTIDFIQQLRQIERDTPDTQVCVAQQKEAVERERKRAAECSAKELPPCASLDDTATYDTSYVSKRFLLDVVEDIKAGHGVSMNNVTVIASLAWAVMKSQPNVQEFEMPDAKDSRFTVVGDLHGQILDLLLIFKLNGMPSVRNPYLFNGDFVDRGSSSCEVLTLLLLLKVVHPQHVLLNRGNHEDAHLAYAYSFERECIRKYNFETFDLFLRVFEVLPLAAVIDKQVFVVHGGLAFEKVTIASINEINRFTSVVSRDTTMHDLLWSDPCLERGTFANADRAASIKFGQDVVEDFFRQNGLKKMIRSHECCERGYEEWFDGLLVTIFSASNYTGKAGNDGSVIVMNKHDITSFRYVSYFAEASDPLATKLSMRNDLVAEDVVVKLLARITAVRLDLTHHYVDASGGESSVIDRKTWSEGLCACLGVDLPFLAFQDQLGLPTLGVNGEPNGPIDYRVFLDAYKPVLSFSSASASAPPSTSHHTMSAAKMNDVMKAMLEQKQASTALLQELTELIFTKRYEMNAIYSYIDSDGDGLVSQSEFEEGILCLGNLLGLTTITKQAVEGLQRIVDRDSDMQISYSEFLQSFTSKGEHLYSAQREELLSDPRKWRAAAQHMKTQVAQGKRWQHLQQRVRTAAMFEHFKT